MALCTILTTAALSLTYSTSIIPASPGIVTPIIDGQYQMWKSTISNDDDDFISFTFSAETITGCGSQVDLEITIPWTGRTYAFPNVVAKKDLEYTVKTKDLPTSTAARTISVSMTSPSLVNQPSCQVKLATGTQYYENDFLDDAASLAVGLLIAIIVGSICCVICICVCIVYLCKKSTERNTTTIIQQQPPQQYQPMVNDGYAVPPGGRGAQL